jgi:predicted amidohydrolase
MDEIPIGICQLASDIGSEDYDPRPANMARAREAIADAAAAGAKLLVFGEVYLNGYESGALGHRFALAEREDDPYVADLIHIARERDVHLLMGATTHKGTFPGDLYNSVLVIGPAGLIGTYSKTHVAAFSFDQDGVASEKDGVAIEKVYWSPGFELPVFDTPLGRIGVEICYDIWFPEVARTLTLKGAELIVNVSAAVCGFENSWDHMLYARSLENTVWYLHVSIVGRQKDFEYFGGSRLFSPFGEVVAEAPRGEESVLVTTAHRAKLIEARGTLHTFYNRNPSLYSAITEPRQAPPATIIPVSSSTLAHAH